MNTPADISPTTTLSPPVSMGLFSILRNHWRRRNRVRVLTRAVQKYSRQQYPADIPAWSLLAEDRPDECVVYQTYEPAVVGEIPKTNHRFFLVKIADLAVSELPLSYRPERWGPHY